MNIRKAFVAVLLLSAVVTTAYAQQYPKPTGYVSDFAQLLTNEQGASLNTELAAFEQKIGVEIAVVTVPWLNNQSIESYTQGLAQEWGVGKRGQNNGVVFLIAPKERKMRIETASGARLILTDGRADQVRDKSVIPRFRAGNMAQGVVDGTHAIMQVFDPLPVSGASRQNAVSAPPEPPNEWTPSDTKVLLSVLGGFASLFVLAVLAGKAINRRWTRKGVLESMEKVPELFADANRVARSSDVKQESRAALAKLAGVFSSISLNITSSSKVDWLACDQKLDSLREDLSRITSEMNDAIAYAKKAREDGPELLKKIPGMLAEAEKRLAGGKSSPKATQYLQRAREQYTQAQTHAGMSTLDWIILYSLLSSIQSNTANAESAHQYANTDHSDDYSSRSSTRDSSPSSSFGFGDSGGFGGGGGFSGGGGGGGSSGSW